MTSIWEAAQALREAAVIRVSILRAFRPGDVIVLESERTLSPQQRQETRDRLSSIIEDSGVKVILLDAGLRVVTREEEAIGGPAR